MMMVLLPLLFSLDVRLARSIPLITSNAAPLRFVRSLISNLFRPQQLTEGRVASIYEVCLTDRRRAGRKLRREFIKSSRENGCCLINGFSLKGGFRVFFFSVRGGAKIRPGRDVM